MGLSPLFQGRFGVAHVSCKPRRSPLKWCTPAGGQASWKSSSRNPWARWPHLPPPPPSPRPAPASLPPQNPQKHRPAADTAHHQHHLGSGSDPGSSLELVWTRVHPCGQAATSAADPPPSKHHQATARAHEWGMHIQLIRWGLHATDASSACSERSSLQKPSGQAVGSRHGLDTAHLLQHNHTYHSVPSWLPFSQQMQHEASLKQPVAWAWAWA